MEKELDLRIKKTYLALTRTFLKLLKEKNFEEITVDQLCREAMVGRATFYKHFEDKYDLLAFIAREAQQQLLENISSLDHTDDPAQFYISVLEYMLNFFDEKKELITSAFKGNAPPILYQILVEHFSLLIQKYMEKDMKHYQTVTLPPELMAQIYTGALIFLCKWWITKKDHPSDKTEIIEQLSILIHKLLAP